jgi:NAD(P)-dependent dehydrogenase (short-subunit alcohol dehydrogenase family)
MGGCVWLILAYLHTAPTNSKYCSNLEDAMTDTLRTSDEVRFDGRVIVVTGAGRGMGRAHAVLLASRGARVVVADSGVAMDGSSASEGPAQSVVTEIADAGGEAIAFTGDLSTEEGCQESIDTTVAKLGRIDGLLHNASTSPNAATADKTSTKDLEMVMRINPFAGYWLTRAAWPHMQKQGYGRIAYISSHSIYGVQESGVYASAKSAYIGMMRALAPEGEKYGILINVILPTGATRMTERFVESPYSRWLLDTMRPERMAVGAAFLLSEQSQIHGEMLSMGGGRIARVLLAETQGFAGTGATIEEVRDAMPDILADEQYFYPRDGVERSLKVAELMGFHGSLDMSELAVKDVSNAG